MAGKHWERYSQESFVLNETDESGSIFIGPEMLDLSSVKIIGESVDTIKQLYSGELKQSQLERIEKLIQHGEDFMIPPSPLAIKWHVTYAGKHSGYKYKLQNNEAGIVVLFKSFYSDKEHSGSHLKIELSPHFISQRGTRQIQQQLDLIANSMLDSWTHNAVSVHLAADVQGWEPAADFIDRFVTRSRSIRDYQGLQSFDFDDLNTVSARYGKNESFLFGKSSSLQIAIYDKSKEIVHSDKQDYFKSEWDKYTDIKSPAIKTSDDLERNWDDSSPVWRIEARFHHNVVRELGHSQSLDFHSYADVAQHLLDLWRYALTINRLDKTPTYIDPFWQVLQQDCHFNTESDGLYFKRVKKVSHGNTIKNIGLMIGNMLTVMARIGCTTSEFMRQLKRLSFFDDILSAYRSVGKTETDIRIFVEKGLALRRIIGKAA